MKFKNELNSWLLNANDDSDLINELNAVKENEEEINDRFYTDLAFGTAGLRGVIGAGTNRMNIYTVRKATRGLAKYMLTQSKSPSVTISRDSRIKSDLFAEEAARILASYGIKTYFFKDIMPTPVLSFAVRHLKTTGGIMITASHNPSKYNGYKVYGDDGCQMTEEAADTVLKLIEDSDIFDKTPIKSFEEYIKDGLVEYVSDEVLTSFLTEVKKQQVDESILKETDLKVIYSPLNGTGLVPVTRILTECGLKNLQVVSEQRDPDGNFPTCPFPNPEIKQVFECGIEMTKTSPADMLFATDPDCDRIGIAVRNDKTGDYDLFSGNETGVLLLNYLLANKKEQGKMPKNPIAFKTIVTTDLAAKVAESYGCEIHDLLTGFKYIGEQLTLLQEKNETNRYILGFEESYGYLIGSHCRDKDAVVASLMICEMAAYYKKQGKSLTDVKNEVYNKFGYYYNYTDNIQCEGETGIEKMNGMMQSIRDNVPSEIAGTKVRLFSDYKISKAKDFTNNQESKITLPVSNVLSFKLVNGESIIIRPSGTEPKIKVYYSAPGKDLEDGKKIVESLKSAMNKILGI